MMIGRQTCSICRTIASGALSPMLPTNTVVTGGFSSCNKHIYAHTARVQDYLDSETRYRNDVIVSLRFG